VKVSIASSIDGTSEDNVRNAVTLHVVTKSLVTGEETRHYMDMRSVTDLEEETVQSVVQEMKKSFIRCACTGKHVVQ